MENEVLKIKVLKDFVDLSINRTRHVGEVFEVTEERFVEIDTALKSYVEKIDDIVDVEPETKKSTAEKVEKFDDIADVDEKVSEIPTVDVDEENEGVPEIPTMDSTVAEIKACLDARDIVYTDNMKKAELLALISE
ncbi:hypothetical protein Hs30E_12850 [Lactococcus hodotermopsidis]|uniref:HeH/LEM domain-containing protein n=1 Tax=Pseudolactococcus hodotermopsidis TaxID=2709157 RepID=A0A6A0BE27_9LACT|nr:hypothetical protein [Lactococcus hodotermopsidis]GFH42734.1 hypothetical protein Hs30E_12850 [Lactococcus hodotermopsidis]